jgi:hypothetical protein
MHRLLPLIAALTLGVLAASPPALADDDPIVECQQLLKVCGSKKDYDGDKCKDLAKELPDCDADTDPGSVCKLPLSAITPTQTAVGVRAAQCKSEDLKRREQEDKFKDGLTRFLLKPNHLVPTVIGPDADQAQGHRFYITDHHHLSYALFLAAIAQGKPLDESLVYACIIADKHKYAMDKFWDYMVRHHYAWLDDNRGRAIEVGELQAVKQLADLKDYPFRTWSRWVRDSCGYLKYGNDCLGKKPSEDDLEEADVQNPPPYFVEFRWADYLAQNLPDLEPLEGMDDATIQAKLTEALALAQGGQAFLEELPGYNDPRHAIFPMHPVTIANGCEAEPAEDAEGR